MPPPRRPGSDARRPATHADLPRWRRLLNRPFVVQLRRDGGEFVVPVGIARRPAGWIAGFLLSVMMTVGVVLAVVAAHAAERSDREGLSALGVELGAALWFGAALTWGARRRATVARALLLLALLVGGLALIGTALLREWSGAGLDLAMEFGVGMLAVPVIDLVLLGVLHQRLRQFADSDGAPVVLRIEPGGRPRLVSSGSDALTSEEVGQ